MMKIGFFIKLISLLFCVFIIISLLSNVFAYAQTNNLPSASGVKNVYLYHYESDMVVFQKGSVAEKIAPASTVKIMTGLLAINCLEHRLDETITVTKDMLTNLQGYSLNINVGMRLKIRDILYCLICGGGNDAAAIVAVLCSGGTEEFVDAMNLQAKEWSLNDTFYTNPTGIDDTMMTTSVQDVVVLSKKAIENTLYMEICSTKSYTFLPLNSNEEISLINRNPLLRSSTRYYNKFAKGLNCGATDNGGYCVSAYATNGNDSYLCIAMGGIQNNNGEIRSYSVASEMLEFMLNKYTYTLVAQKGLKVGELTVENALPTNGSRAVTVDCVLQENIYALAPNDIDYKKDLRYEAYYHNEILSAPVISDTVVGGVRIYYGDEYISEGKLIAKNDIPESGLLVTLAKMRETILSRKTLVFIIVLALSLISCVLLHNKKKTRKKSSKF